MMRVRRLTKTGDWTFGKGKADYLRRSEAIRQNVVTRLKSFTDDWFADINAGLPWIELLGNRQTQERILREIEETVLTTEGVRSIDRLSVTDVTDRDAKIQLRFTDMFDRRYDETVGIL